jgi:hypothetical protein
MLAVANVVKNTVRIGVTLNSTGKGKTPHQGSINIFDNLPFSYLQKLQEIISKRFATYMFIILYLPLPCNFLTLTMTSATRCLQSIPFLFPVSGILPSRLRVFIMTQLSIKVYLIRYLQGVIRFPILVPSRLHAFMQQINQERYKSFPLISLFSNIFWLGQNDWELDVTINRA